ncbi:GDP-L-fucose synthase family protein [Oligosphaera ethanolica]|uniref:GDP-L-fucose synthase n=1 Tax=Oligosphaera ethanolica TaxID=760260 RepID=A0AAE4APX5_9BACT|nr:GDP-L-fucose synthase [Oligosphaera ethanolica]MDQ0289872.1 GDP-L-fucose synthase [Oligosphaera ethanolica]
MDKNAKIFVAGHRGMVGSAVCRRLAAAGYGNVVVRSHAELELRDQQAVRAFFAAERPDYVVLASARVGGIMANQSYKAEFLLENLEIQNNVIMESYKHDVKKLCFLGSSCIYPREAPQPIKEEYLLTGPLEPTNEGYALAKIAGYKLCLYLSEQYGFKTVSLMPCNLYGTNDNYDPQHSHVFPALIRRFVEAARDGRPDVVLWGTGRPLREFLHVDDVAMAVLFFMEKHEDPNVVNVGYGSDVTIRELAEKIARAAGFQGRVAWDSSKPDGMYRKLMDSSKARQLGWAPTVSLDNGIRQTIEEFRALHSG